MRYSIEARTAKYVKKNFVILPRSLSNKYRKKLIVTATKIVYMLQKLNKKNS